MKPTVQVSLRIPVDQYEHLKALADEEKVSVQRYLINLADRQEIREPTALWVTADRR